jgi:sugar/nucleoside kinase (ribokinase family)
LVANHHQRVVETELAYARVAEAHREAEVLTQLSHNGIQVVCDKCYLAKTDHEPTVARPDRRRRSDPAPAAVGLYARFGAISNDGSTKPTLMLATLGDLVEDVVVRHDGPINNASDTLARITRRRGGSAANVASVAAHLGYRTRFIGQVGTDAIGRALVDELDAEGVEVSAVRRSGTTGTIVALVDHAGERTMLTDRRACLDLDQPDPAWLDNVTVLHVPFYSLVEPPISDTAITVIGWAHERQIPVSIDASSSSIIEMFGVAETRELLADLDPAVLLANGNEATTLGIDGPLGNTLVVIKRGPQPAVVLTAGSAPIEIPAIAVDSVSDTTGAGDAFAAGFLCYDDEVGWLVDPIEACRAGHRAAATILTSLR